jgi:hypothetical protein
MDFLVSFQSSSSQDIRQPGTAAKTQQHNITSLLSRSPHLKMFIKTNGASSMNKNPTTETTDAPLDNLTSF